MQAVAILSASSLRRLFEVVFNEPVIVATAYSDFGESIKRFASADELEAHRRGRASEIYALHYRDTGGHVEDRRITLDPRKCNGHTFRYSVDGWGLIRLQIKEMNEGLCECGIAVNSPKRAGNWADTCPDLKDPSLWNWAAVEKHARRLIRQLKKSAAQQAVAAGAPQASRR